jgi:hypothetical protein
MKGKGAASRGTIAAGGDKRLRWFHRCPVRHAQFRPSTGTPSGGLRNGPQLVAVVPRALFSALFTDHGRSPKRPPLALLMQAAAVLTSAAMPLRQTSVPHCREKKASVFDLHHHFRTRQKGRVGRVSRCSQRRSQEVLRGIRSRKQSLRLLTNGCSTGSGHGIQPVHAEMPVRSRNLPSVIRCGTEAYMRVR